MIFLKCCIQYASKFGKLSSGHRTGKGQFSFQSQRRAMGKNVQATEQLCSFHMPARLCSKSFKLAFSSMWTEKFQIYKLSLEKAEEKEIKLPILVESGSSKGISGKHLLLIYWLLKSLSFVDHNKLWKILKEMGVPDCLTCLLRNLYAGQEATVRTGYGTMGWFKCERNKIRLYIITLLI